ncbi:MAG TPA: hypothetical protein VF693_03125 [Allosphingosinicella sp.]|jgi:hypothetical protein
MLPKMSRARRGAFLKALDETGNQTLAAERACVSRRWVLKERKADPAFDAACRAAIEAAFARFRSFGENRPPGSWGHLDGADLVVRGSNRRRLQIARARPGQISPRTEDRFLAVLAATCNVAAACSAAGISKGAAYCHRRRWANFARRWAEAVREGAIHLEFGLLENCGNIFSSRGLPPAIDTPPMRTDEILHNLYMHQHEVYGIGSAPGLPPREMDFEEAGRSFHARIDAIERGRALGEETKRRDREEWARRRGSAQMRPSTNPDERAEPSAAPGVSPA